MIFLGLRMDNAESKQCRKQGCLETIKSVLIASQTEMGGKGY